ncbi:MAG: carbohydrate-binding protein, partial [Spartobacteria bacterium]|nr:carbohydrate-binding protein [Spartobacteria bacterium]
AMPLPNTGGWDIFQTIVLEDVWLTSGAHMLKWVARTHYFYVDGLDVGHPGTVAGETREAFSGVTPSIPCRMEAEEFDKGGPGIAYRDTTAGNAGGAYRANDHVDIYATDDVGGGYRVYANAAGEWLEYSINVETEGTYDIALRIATPYDNRALSVWVDGENISGTTMLPNTGGWDAFQTVYITNVLFAAADHIVRINTETHYYYINHLTICDSTDRDMDEMPDAWEQQIIDADLLDDIAFIEVVLPGDDFDGDGATNLEEYLAGTDPADPASTPDDGTDCFIEAGDVQLSTATPAVDETFSITATVHNAGVNDLSDVSVRLLLNGALCTGDQVIPTLPGNGDAQVVFTLTCTNAQVAVVSVEVDPDDTIEEIHEDNNRATTLVTVGNPGVGARLVVRAQVPARTAPSLPIFIHGIAHYEIPVGGVTNTYPVEGAAVQVLINDGTDYSTSHTDRDGHFSQRIITPDEYGVYHLYVIVDDNSILGQDEVVLVVGEAPEPAFWFDLVADACDGFTVGNPNLNAGDSTTVEVTVSNTGNSNAFDVVVDLYDVDALVQSVAIAQIGASASETVSFNYTAPGWDNTHRILKAVIHAQEEERNPFNNVATKIISVGAPTDTPSIQVERYAAPASLYVNQAGQVRGKAFYYIEIEGAPRKVVVAGADVHALMNGVDFSSGRTDMFGNGVQGIAAPSVTGQYSVVMHVDDCSGLAELTSATAMIDVRPVPDDVWVYSRNIYFSEAAIEESAQAPTGFPFSINVIINHALNGVRTVPVVVRDIYTDANSNLVSEVIYSDTLTLTASGVASFDIGYTGTVVAAHIIEVDIDAAFGNPDNDEATRALQVGPPQPLLVVNILQPVNGITLTPDATPVRVRVFNEGAVIQEPSLLSRLQVTCIPENGMDEEFYVLVEDGALMPGVSFADNEYSFEWNPIDSMIGRVNVHVLAVAKNNSSGEDMNYVNMIPKPVDLAVSASDITFSITNPDVGEAFAIAAQVHNTGTEAVSDVRVRIYANGTQIGADLMIPAIAGGASAMTQVDTSYSDDEVLIITVDVDPENAIVETNEDNNRATKLLEVGSPGVQARLVVRAAVPGVRCPGTWYDVTGYAYYELIMGLVTNTYQVEGALVSVEIADMAVYEGAHTDVAGYYRQRIVVPQEEGRYDVYITVTDDTLVGQEEVNLFSDADACTAGQALDLEMRACGGFELASTTVAPGEVIPVSLTVWNNGNINATDVEVTLYDLDAEVASGIIPLVNANSSEDIVLEYTVPTVSNTYRVLRAAATEKPAERNPYNNAATKVIVVGAVANPAELVVDDLSITTPLYINQSGRASGKVRYMLDIEGVAQSIPAAGVTLRAEVVGESIHSGARTDDMGNGTQGLSAPSVTGMFSVALSADDCSGLVSPVSATGSLRVLPLPDDVWVYSQDIRFNESEIHETGQVPTNYPFSISIAVHHSIDDTRAVPVMVRDIYTDEMSNQVIAVLYTDTLTLSGSGFELMTVGYTGLIAGAHVIEAVVDTSYGNLNNDKATRALQVGPPEPLLVVNIMEPVNGEVTIPDPIAMRIRVLNEGGIVQCPEDLLRLEAAYTPQSGSEGELFLVVDNGMLASDVYFIDDEYQWDWDPADSLEGRVDIRATA